jgi:ParB-like chromosome segregation protein Spo0J
MPSPSKRTPARERLELRIEELDPSSLQLYRKNARTHSPRQLQQLAESISCFGFVIPALINANGVIIAGHARVEAAKTLGLGRIPCIRVEHLSRAQEGAY